MAYDATQVARIIIRILDQCAHPQAALRVWTVLQLHAGPEQVTEFDRANLADLSNVAVGTVSRAITELKTIGALDRVPSRNPRQGRGPITVRMRRFW